MGRIQRPLTLVVLIDGDRLPVCSEIWPGNTADVTTLIPVIDGLRRRFDIAGVCVVADRGTISTETMAELEALLYIPGGYASQTLIVRSAPRPAASLALRRRRAAADRPRRRSLLIPPQRKCSAKPPARLGLPRLFS